MKIRGFFTGYKGQRTFNYAYSIGASIVILGALFKLLHLWGADYMLIVGMGTEAVIFFLSAFDEPAKDYKWENVYPELDVENPEENGEYEKPEHRHVVASSSPVVVVGNVNPVQTVQAADIEQAAQTFQAAQSIPQSSQTIQGAQTVQPVQPVQNLQNIQPVLPVVNPIANPDAVSEATDSYVKQMLELKDSITKLQETLTQNIQGLNAMYELQLRDASSQLDSVNKVHQETEQMTKTIAQLNEIYQRMLEAMKPKA